MTAISRLRETRTRELGSRRKESTFICQEARFDNSDMEVVRDTNRIVRIEKIEKSFISTHDYTELSEKRVKNCPTWPPFSS